MRHLLLSFALALIATSALAAASDRDVLITPDGIVYTVSSELATPATSLVADAVLDLNIQDGSNVRHVTVPSSKTAGFHFGGTLAYDPDSKTLFVLWIHMNGGGGSSEILLSSYRDGTWQPAVTIDSQSWLISSNLRLGITRRVSQLQKDGSYADTAALLLHAVWWNDAGGKGEEARYALLPVENGAVSSAAVEVHSLEEFIASAADKYNPVDSNFNEEILRHPAIVSAPAQNSVDIIFGDTKNNSLHGVTLRPIADTRVHIPVGVGGGRPSIPAPVSFSADWKGPISVISRGDRLVFANANEKSLSYLTYTSGSWSAVKSIAIDSRFPAEAALSALDKMVSAQ